MIDPRFVLLGALLSLTGSLRYAWLTTQGRTRPNRVTWFLWALAPAIGFCAQLDEGVGLPSVLTLSIAVGPALIFASTFVNPAAYWQLGRIDLTCGLVSLLALVVWLGLDAAALAVVVAVLADLVAGIPTIRKAWTHPETEHPAVFVLGGLNGVIALLTIDTWTAATWAFPVYITALGTAVAVIVVLRGPHAASPLGGCTGPGTAT
jgi:hypothetical protein